MSEIRVFLKEPSDHGRLYARYDKESNVLIAESRIPREWPYGINVAGDMVIDVDRNRLLANVDIMMPPRKAWPVSDDDLKPQVDLRADIYFDHQTLEQQSFDPKLTIQANKSRSIVLVLFGAKNSSVKGVELSENCIAILDNGSLIGFYISLE